MDLKNIKSKITKTLKKNGFIKSEIKKYPNHIKHKITGFEYAEMFETAYETELTYYIADNIYLDKDKQKLIKDKVKEMYSILIKNELDEYLTFHQFGITVKVDNPYLK